MRTRFSLEARHAVLLAQVAAGERGSNELRPGHLLYALLLAGEGPVAAAAEALGVDRALVRRRMEEHLTGAAFVSEGGIRPTAAYHAVEQRAYDETRRRRAREVGPMELLLAVLAETQDGAVAAAADAGLTLAAARAQAAAPPSLLARLFSRR